jgi:Nuclease-related domain/TPR repeat/Tetratricopeptide repeat
MATFYYGDAFKYKHELDFRNALITEFEEESNLLILFNFKMRVRGRKPADIDAAILTSQGICLVEAKYCRPPAPKIEAHAQGPWRQSRGTGRPEPMYPDRHPKGEQESPYQQISRYRYVVVDYLFRNAESCLGERSKQLDKELCYTCVSGIVCVHPDLNRQSINNIQEKWFRLVGVTDLKKTITEFKNSEGFQFEIQQWEKLIHVLNLYGPETAADLLPRNRSGGGLRVVPPSKKPTAVLQPGSAPSKPNWTPPPPPRVPVVIPSFDLIVAPQTTSVDPGGSASYTVNVKPSGGFAGLVKLSSSDLPYGSAYFFNPPSVKGGEASKLTIATDADSLPGRFDLTITGTHGELVRTTRISIELLGPRGVLVKDLASELGVGPRKILELLPIVGIQEDKGFNIDRAIASRIREILGWINRQGGSEAYAYFQLGNKLKNEGALDGAIAAYRQAIRLIPEAVHMDLKSQYEYAYDVLARTLESKGDLLMSKGNLESAAEAYREAIRINPPNATVRAKLESLVGVPAASRNVI